MIYGYLLLWVAWWVVGLFYVGLFSLDLGYRRSGGCGLIVCL